MRPDHRWGRQKRISTTASTPRSASRALLDILHRMNGNTYHVGRVVCLLVCGGRLGVRSILRWSSTNGTAASILAVARMGIACVSLRRGGTDHSFPYFNSGLLQQRGPPAARTPRRPAAAPAKAEILHWRLWVWNAGCIAVRVCFIETVSSVSCASVWTSARKGRTREIKPWKVFLCFIICIHVYLH